MKYGLSDASVLKIYDVFRRNSKIKEAVVFGSRAMNTYREGSDIDITLKGNLTFNDLLSIENQLDNKMLPYKIDLSLYHKLENPKLIDHIKRVGITLYIQNHLQEI